MTPAVTTAASGDPAEAEDFARRFGLRALNRDGRPLHELQKEAPELLVLAKTRADLHIEGASYRASAGMAFLRVLRARKGELDPLVVAGELSEGDRVLDCTLGLGGDALVAAAATKREVVGLEANGLLAAFTQAAMTRLPGHGRDAGRLVRVENADHQSFLRAQKDRSFDVVFFDPMFRTAGDAGPLFELVRKYGDHTPLDAETLREARRVARKRVVIKDSAPGAEELKRLGLTPHLSRRSATICFGWL